MINHASVSRAAIALPVLCRVMGWAAGISWLASLFGPFSESGLWSVEVIAFTARMAVELFPEWFAHGSWAMLSYLTTPMAAFGAAYGARPRWPLWLSVFFLFSSPLCWEGVGNAMHGDATAAWGPIAWFVSVTLLLSIGCIDLVQLGRDGVEAAKSGDGQG